MEKSIQDSCLLAKSDTSAFQRHSTTELTPSPFSIQPRIPCANILDRWNQAPQPARLKHGKFIFTVLESRSEMQGSTETPFSAGSSGDSKHDSSSSHDTVEFVAVTMTVSSWVFPPIIYLYVQQGEGLHVTVHVWKTEDNPVELTLCFNLQVGSRDQTGFWAYKANAFLLSHLASTSSQLFIHDFFLWVFGSKVPLIKTPDVKVHPKFKIFS